MSIAHVCIPVRDFKKVLDFYLEALKPIGLKKIIEIPGKNVVGLGIKTPDFWITGPDSPLETNAELNSPTGIPLHLCFNAENREQVKEFHKAALAIGAKCNGEPGIRNYAPNYYAAFVIDPEGVNLEVMCMKPEE